MATQTGREKHMNNKHIKAILFDLDGTLLDTLDDLAESVNQVLSESGAPIHPVESYKRFVGDGIVTLAQRALGKTRCDDRTVGAFVARLKTVYAARETLKTRPYPGVPEMLIELEQRGVRMAILSNKPDKATRSITKSLLGNHPFDIVRGQLDGVPRKPDPFAALSIARELGIPAGSFAYAGDSGSDMQTARSAGMFAIGVLWGFRNEQELNAGGADAVVTRPRDILAYVDTPH